MDVKKLFWVAFLLTSKSFASVTDSVAETETKCKPYRAYLIWDTCSNKNIFYTQRNAIIQLIDKMPNGSLVHFTRTVATSEKTINIIKDNSNREWQTIVSQLVPEQGCMKQKIQLKHIKVALDGTRGRHDAQEMAALIFFLLDKGSKIDKAKKAKRFLKDKLTYLMFTGKHNVSLPLALVGIGTDDNHEFKLSTVKNIGDLLDVVCKDSRLLCGTTNFWNSKICESCSFICSSDPPKYCQQECPYYKKSTLSILGHSEHVFKETTGNVSKQHINISIVALILGICTFVFSLCFCMYGFRTRQGKKGTVNEQQFLVYLYNENNGTEDESSC